MNNVVKQTVVIANMGINNPNCMLVPTVIKVALFLILYHMIHNYEYMINIYIFIIMIYDSHQVANCYVVLPIVD